ncbi:MAG TPA: sigma-54 dependent transcriptional regulator [Polyangiaceae bacterium]|nr:sigma-54 dependent transcriptional regulator [Polyangiaceae bacterium]
MNGRVLIVDDEQSMCELLESALSKRGYETAWRTSADQAFEVLDGKDYDLVLTDLNMRDMTGLELCERIVASRPDVPVVLVTAFGSMDNAVAAIRAGAYDFITKPVEMDALALVVERAIQHRTLKEEVKRLRQAAEATRQFDEMIGESPAMRKVNDLILRVADSDANVLITGESGCGKELVARALHARSTRSEGPFVAVNCAAVPETLLESELFGHAKGAFTDARQSRTGLFVQASGGTLFLDEVGEMPLGMQPKILRALQERKVRPVGGNTEVSFDSRLVTATNRDLETEVEERRFREDLYYRINVVRIEVPPLRGRGNDLLLLAQHFIERAASRSGKSVVGLVSAAAEKLLSYDWPGNVRELENCMERAVALTRYDQVTVEDLPEKVRNYQSSHVVVASDDPSELLPMQEVERRYIQRVLKSVGGNKTQAAKVLGFDRRTLYRKLERYGLA